MRFTNEIKKKRKLTTIQFVKRIQNDVQNDVMCDAKWHQVSLLKCKWRSRNRISVVLVLAACALAVLKS